MENKYCLKIAKEVNEKTIEIYLKYYNEYKKNLDDDEKIETCILCKKFINQLEKIKEEILKKLEEEKEVK